MMGVFETPNRAIYELIGPIVEKTDARLIEKVKKTRSVSYRFRRVEFYGASLPLRAMLSVCLKMSPTAGMRQL